MGNIFTRVLFLIIFLILPLKAYGGSFDVTPTRVFLDRNNRIDNIKVTSRSDKEVIIQVKAYEWSQDENGKDIYLETKDLMYFPRILNINPKEERFIKIGYEKKPSAVEKTFRVFVEEVPQAEEKSEEMTLRIALKMGIPVFVAPGTKTQLKGEIVNAGVSKGQVSFEVKNVGNAHFIIKNIKIQGADSSGNVIFSENKQGWYVLTGKSRSHSINIPQDKCPLLKEINIELDLDKLTIKDKINVDKKMCEPRSTAL